MGIIDYLAKRRGYVKTEEKSPEIKSRKRSFAGAKVGRLTASWVTQPKPIDADIRAGLRTLRARIRDESLNNDYVRRFLAVTKSNVVGPQGIVLQARSKDGEKLDEKANKAIEDAWVLWGKQGSPDVTGQHSWRSLQRLFIETAPKDGEVLVRKIKNWSGNTFRFALQLIDVESLDVDYNRDLGEGRSINMAVELNEWRKPIAYHILTTSSTADYYSYGGKKYIRIPASEIIHAFLPESVWQTRGFPWLSSAMTRMNMLNGYEEAELVAARTASAKMGFFETDAGGVGEYVGDEIDDEGNVITDAEPGSLEQLPPGMKFSSWDPQHPSTAFKDFVKANLRGIAAGLGISYHTLANDLEGVNYSSGRLGALEDREAWKALQEWMIEVFCMPVYEEWLYMALLTKSIPINGGSLKGSRMDKYLKVSWQPRRWAWVDPQKDMKANTEAIGNRIRSRSDVIRERGDDPEDVWQEIKRENDRMTELGILPIEKTNTTEQTEETVDENENN